MLVLSIFKDTLLIFNRLYNLSKPSFILFSRFIIDLSLQIKIVSSANKIGDIIGRSFIYNKHTVGPNIDTCGTPH